LFWPQNPLATKTVRSARKQLGFRSKILFQFFFVKPKMILFSKLVSFTGKPTIFSATQTIVKRRRIWPKTVKNLA
jgi:hypothetical protein